jgi:transcriptional regulator
LKHLNALTEMHESTRNPRWRISDAPQEYIEKMMEHIVGIELPIASLEGKWKVSQNRPEVDRIEVAARLQDQGDNKLAGNYSRAMADLVLRGSAKTHKAS